MAYRFRMDEPVERGVRRIACEQIDEAVAAIRSDAVPLERIVHEVRRRCKALRALIRLVKPVFPDFAAENMAFRDIAHALAGSRDAKVLADTLDALADDDADAAGQKLVARLRKRLAKPRDNPAAVHKALDKCATQLLAARGRAEHWTLSAEGWDAISGGLARTVRSARRAMKTLDKADDATCSHEWRKHVKYHWHHMRLLRITAPDAASERIRLAARLADLLGARHDLDLFVETLDAQPGRAGDAATLDLLIARARKRAARLEAKARVLGERLFDEKPRKLAGKWGERWRDRVKDKAFA
jgi:hypothetical protein